MGSARADGCELYIFWGRRRPQRLRGHRRCSGGLFCHDGCAGTDWSEGEEENK